MPVNTPVVFVVFNRPDVTARVFDRLAQAKPRTLLVVGDGPRPDRAGEEQLVDQTRSIIDRVDWPCDLRTDFSETNLGCKRRVFTGLSWVFENYEQAIILEDDCLPDLSFFTFCDALLDRFADDDRVSGISGNNFQFGQSVTPYSYYFSKYAHCWGWATWRRTWSQFDLEMEGWPEFRDRGGLQSVADSSREEAYWRWVFDAQFEGRIKSWGYPWQFTRWTQSGLTILPDVNLVSNLGFGADATHTKFTESRLANLPTDSLSTLEHPQFIVRNKAADQQTFASVYGWKRPFYQKWARSLRKRFGATSPARRSSAA